MPSMCRSKASMGHSTFQVFLAGHFHHFAFPRRLHSPDVIKRTYRPSNGTNADHILEQPREKRRCYGV